MADNSPLARYHQFLCKCAGLGVQLDLSKSGISLKYLASMEPSVQSAFEAMDALEAGAIANPDEQRMVGHYWLRAAQLAFLAVLDDVTVRALVSEPAGPVLLDLVPRRPGSTP